MKRMGLFLALVLIVTGFCMPAFATNGDNLISVGPISRAMGGVGIAAPEDAISAVFLNPAAMCFGPYCPASQVDFAGTLFMPEVSARVKRGDTVIQADSDDQVYAIPAIGISSPLGPDLYRWRFGFAAYGVTGLGVDYRGSNLDQSRYEGFGGAAPLIAGEYSQLQIFKFAPSLAYQATDFLSVGLAVHVDYSSLDLRNGNSFGYAVGAQAGIIYKPWDHVSLGLTYVSPQEVEYDNVQDFDADGSLDDLSLESPQQVGFGAAFKAWGNRLLLETDIRWINWGDATGYRDFGWDNQWVFGIGVQVKPLDWLSVRLGYNYGENPVNANNGFNGTSMVTVQGKTMPRYYYETFRMVGFPAVVEHHLGVGVGIDLSERFAVHLGYVHAFENSLSERGTDITGQPVELESSLMENSFDFALTWKF